MPEGPEIRRAADRIAAAIANRPLQTVWFAKPELERFSKRLSKSTVVNVRTKGKALLTEFSCGLTVYSHNQLYGRWYVTKPGQRPSTKRQLRWIVETVDQAALLYSASEIAVLDDAQLALHPFLARAGIDVLSDQPSLAALTEYVGRDRFARRNLGGLLLDQGFVAGIGNYLRSEILFAAGLHHSLRPSDLNGHQRRRLARQIIRMTERAYETGGITNDPKTVRQLQAQGWRRSRYRHFVFARMNAPCHGCGTAIVKQTVAGRRLYWCPVCQPV